MGDLRNRFPDLIDKNFDLVQVHSSMSDIDPVASFVRQRFVLAPVEDEGEAALLVSVILKLDLPLRNPLAQAAVSAQIPLSNGERCEST